MPLKFLFINVLLGIAPNEFNLGELNSLPEVSVRVLEDNLADDSIVDLRWGFDSNASVIFAGTSGGLSRIDLLDGSVSFSHYVDSSLPEGGNPAMDTFYLPSGETMIVVSGVLSQYIDFEDDDVPYGTGIAWSLDSGQSWYFSSQPIDELPSCEDVEQSLCSPLLTGCSWHPVNGCTYQGSYLPFDWYGQTIYSNPITTEFKNVTYDISVDVDQNYIYIASWAGMLRRLKYTDFEPDWELVPLPVDIEQVGDNDAFLCGSIDQSYVYNPVDVSGHYNHKAFSVYVQQNDNGADNEIWVGTANGINRGTIGDGGCIDWTHQTSLNSNIAGDWIIDVVPQHLEFNQEPRIWLISREVVSPPVPHGLTYSDDSGNTWTIVDYFNDIEEGGTEPSLVYNLYFSDSSPEIYASTSTGLYFSENGNEQIWQRLNEVPDDCYNDTHSVYSNIEDDFLGTSNGLIYRCDNEFSDKECGEGWCEYDEYVTPSSGSKLSIYPNPADSFTNFMYRTDIESGRVDIFDFSMNRVSQGIECVHSLEADGNHYLMCDYDSISLNNGVYFCRLKYGNSEVWNKLMIARD